MNAYAYARRNLSLHDGRTVGYYSLAALADEGLGDVSRFPCAMKILLEMLMRQQAHAAFDAGMVASLAAWQPGRGDRRREYPYLPSRVLLQDFTGVPCIVDLAALRDGLARLGGDPSAIEPSIPVDLIIDHSVQVDAFACREAYEINLKLENERNAERYDFLRWGQAAFDTLRVLPPGLGICHQVNMEFLGRCVATAETDAGPLAFPDTLVGTDSHTPMINSMGILGWGVGGIEAEAAMLGQPIPILTPLTTGVRLSGALPAGTTPTDLALTVVSRLRAVGVVGHFVEFCGPGLDQLTLADRAPLANMAPEYGATIGFFPVDHATLDYLRMTGRTPALVDLVERYCKVQGLFRETGAADPLFDQVIDIDLGALEPSVAGPKRPQDRQSLSCLHTEFRRALTETPEARGFGVPAEKRDRGSPLADGSVLTHGSVVIAAITSCTNTSNPTLMLGAGILARKAVARGLRVPSWVKTSLAPGSRVVTEYLKRAEVLPALETLGFHVVGYGCTTCIGNSGPLPEPIEAAIRDEDLVVAAVLSGNRNFEGRIHPLTQANYLCSPPLVVAYALRGAVTDDMVNDPLGHDPDGQPVYLRDLWPTPRELAEGMKAAADPELYRAFYADVYDGAEGWGIAGEEASCTYAWNTESSYIREPPWVADVHAEPDAPTDIHDARVLGLFGDFVTTDHISPAGAIGADSVAGGYLVEQGVPPAGFNSFGSRRGNHEVMLRGTFANIRVRNQLVERTGGWTRHLPSGETVSIYEAARRYQSAQTPLIVLAGKMYGAGSSRDWAAKGAALLGVRAVLAESYERIHRSNLVGMGVLPLEFMDGQSAATLGLSGTETFTITGIAGALEPGAVLDVRAAGGGEVLVFPVRCRIDSPVELAYYQHGGILTYVLRQYLV